MFDGLLKTLRYLFTKDDATRPMRKDYSQAYGVRDYGNGGVTKGNQSDYVVRRGR